MYTDQKGVSYPAILTNNVRNDGTVNLVIFGTPDQGYRIDESNVPLSATPTPGCYTLITAQPTNQVTQP